PVSVPGTPPDGPVLCFIPCPSFVVIFYATPFLTGWRCMIPRCRFCGAMAVFTPKSLFSSQILRSRPERLLLSCRLLWRLPSCGSFQNGAPASPGRGPNPPSVLYGAQGCGHMF